MLRNPQSPAKANRHFRPGRILCVKANVEVHKGLGCGTCIAVLPVYQRCVCGLEICPSLHHTCLSQHHHPVLLKASQPGHI